MLVFMTELSQGFLPAPGAWFVCFVIDLQGVAFSTVSNPRTGAVAPVHGGSGHEVQFSILSQHQLFFQTVLCLIVSSI